MAIYLVRHGQSEGNRRKVFQGSLPFELTELGIRQAQACGRWLAGQAIKPVHVFTSPMIRAQQTAKIISQLLAGPEPVVHQDLREIGAGELEGLTEPEARSRFADYDEQNLFAPPDTNSWGGETFARIGERAEQFRRYIESKHADDDVLAVSHGGLLGMLVKQWCGWPTPQRMFIEWSNCCSVKLLLCTVEGQKIGRLQWFVPLEISAPDVNQQP